MNPCKFISPSYLNDMRCYFWIVDVMRSMMMINFDDYSAYQLHNAVVFSYSAVNNEFESAVTETCVHGAHGSKLWMGNKQQTLDFAGTSLLLACLLPPPSRLYFCLYLFVCQQDNKNCQRILVKKIAADNLINDKRLDHFGGDLDHSVAPGIFQKKVLLLWTIVRILWNEPP